MASKAIFIQRDCCYVGLLLWRSLFTLSLRRTAVASPQGGALSLSSSCVMFPEELNLGGSQWGFLPHNDKNKTVTHSHSESRELTKFKKWPKFAVMQEKSFTFWVVALWILYQIPQFIHFEGFKTCMIFINLDVCYRNSWCYVMFLTHCISMWKGVCQKC